MKTATSLSLLQAAAAVGMVKSTLSKAHKAGDVAAFRDEKGRLWFEPNELIRAFGTLKMPDEVVSADDDENVSDDAEETLGNDKENSVLKVQLEFLREKVALLDKLKSSEIGMLSSQIEELRRDKEDLRSERDKLLTTLQEQAIGMRLLTDQRSAPAPSAAAVESEPARRRGLFGWKRG